jgi:hypothetical protein
VPKQAASPALVERMLRIIEQYDAVGGDIAKTGLTAGFPAYMEHWQVESLVEGSYQDSKRIIGFLEPLSRVYEHLFSINANPWGVVVGPIIRFGGNDSKEGSGGNGQASLSENVAPKSIHAAITWMARSPSPEATELYIKLLDRLAKLSERHLFLKSRVKEAGLERNEGFYQNPFYQIEDKLLRVYFCDLLKDSGILDIEMLLIERTPMGVYLSQLYEDALNDVDKEQKMELWGFFQREYAEYSAKEPLWQLVKGAESTIEKKLDAVERHLDAFTEIFERKYTFIFEGVKRSDDTWTRSVFAGECTQLRFR